MAKFDMMNSVKAVRMASPFDQADTTNLVGESVDTQGFEGLLLLFATGAINDLVSTILVEDSPDDSVFTAVPDSQLHGLETDLTIAADDDDKVAQLGYHGGQRYVRVTFVVTTGSGVNLIAGIYLLGLPQRAATTAAAFN